MPSAVVIRRSLIAVLCAGMLPAVLLAKNFEKPVARPAKTYPAHDIHSDEKVAIGVDPYDTPEKSKIFSVDFQENGLLPVFLVVTNDGDQPISIAHIEITLLTANRSKLTPISTDDLYRRLSNPQARTSPNPFPIPRKTVKTGISKKAMEEIETSQ